MNRAVIYTCITAEYDELRQPWEVHPEFDYVCFVPAEDSRIGTKVGVWQIRGIDFESPNDRVHSRFVKLNPHLVFPEYDYSLWIDGNVTIADGALYDRLLDEMRKGTIYMGIKHPKRNCSYREAFKCYHYDYITYPMLKDTLRFLFRKRLPLWAGLMENNVIFRRHNDPQVVCQSEEWWKLFMQLPYRDQFTHTLSLRYSGVKPVLLLPEKCSVRRWPWFAFFDHTQFTCVGQIP